MKSMSNTKKLTISGVCVALCIVLPVAFHVIPNAGSIYCPIHIPVLLCGIICGWNFGLLCGLLGPVLSCLITQMPPVAMLPSMMVELVAYGAITGIFMRIIKTKNLYADLYISLTITLILGRVVAGISRALIFSAGSYSFAVWVTSYFITSWPGIIIQLIFIPSIVVALEKAKLITKRY